MKFLLPGINTFYIDIRKFCNHSFHAVPVAPSLQINKLWAKGTWKTLSNTKRCLLMNSACLTRIWRKLREFVAQKRLLLPFVGIWILAHEVAVNYWGKIVNTFNWQRKFKRIWQSEEKVMTNLVLKIDIRFIYPEKFFTFRFF